MDIACKSERDSLLLEAAPMRVRGFQHHDGAVHANEKSTRCVVADDR
jgi:hypothetical protein